MYKLAKTTQSEREEFLAELTDAAYRVALQHRFEGSFLDVELDLWKALRSAYASHRIPVVAAVPVHSHVPGAG